MWKGFYMNENENLVVNATENAEHTAEETPKPAKTYTQEEVDAIIGKKKARWEEKARRDAARTYGGLIETLEEGSGVKGVEELNEFFTKAYTEKGRIKKKPSPEYSTKDIEALAKADADEIISYGDDEVAEELNRLTEIGAAKMTARDKAVFKVLEKHMREAELSREMQSIGVTEDVYNSAEFKEFKKDFNPNTPIKKIYDLYQKTQPKKEIKPMGSMKTTTSTDNGVKDYYSPEEAKKFTRKQLDENPALFNAICNSMQKWKK